MKRNEKKPLGCGICPYKTNSACHLERHLRIHTGQKPYACEMCSYRATDGGLLKRHMRIHSGEKPFICHICGHKTAQSCSLKDHMAVHTGKKRYSCDLCSFQCSRIGRLRDHQRVHKVKAESALEDVPRDEAPVPSSNDGESKIDVNNVLHKCSHCSLEFSEIQYLERHIASVHSAGLAKPVQSLADSPVNDDHKEPPYFCSLCATPQESSKALDSHMALHILYKCLKCNSIFETPEELSAHGFTHTNELIFNCNFCDFKCKTRNELRGHGRIHSTQQFKCSTCDFESKSVIEFSQHLVTHTMKEMVICNICSQKFRKTEELRDHMVSHYSRVRTRTVRKIDELRQGNTNQAVGDSYSCFYCSFKCPEEREVEKHIIDVHVSPTLSTKHANDTMFSKISCDEQDENTAKNAINDNRLPQHEELDNALIHVSSAHSDHQQTLPFIAGLSKTVDQQMYRRPFFIDNKYSRRYRGCRLRNLSEMPFSTWENHGYAGHYLGKQSHAYSMHQYVQLNSDPRGVNRSPCGHPSLSIKESSQMYESFPMSGYLTHYHHFHLQTDLLGVGEGKVKIESGSELGMSIVESEGMLSPFDGYDSPAGVRERLSEMKTKCDIFSIENKSTQNTAKRPSPEGERIGSKLVKYSKSKNFATEKEDCQFVSNTTEKNSQSKSKLKCESLPVDSLSGKTRAEMVSSSKVTEDVVVPSAFLKSGKDTNYSLTKYNNSERIGEGRRSIDGAKGVKRQKNESTRKSSKVSDEELKVTRNSHLREKNHSLRDTEIQMDDSSLPNNTAETAQSASTATREGCSGDILLSKLRKFFNGSLPNFNNSHSNGNFTPNSCDATVASSAIYTIDLSSDNETSDFN